MTTAQTTTKTMTMLLTTSMARNTTFGGMTLQGVPAATFVGGRVVWQR